MVRSKNPRTRIVDVLNPGTEPGVDPVLPEPVADVAAPAFVPARVPESEMTPEQLRIRDLENQLALERGRQDPEPELEPAPATGENILIHFTADGLTALGKIWVRGQEIEFAPGSRAYADTCDRNGRSWLELRDNPAAQEARWGEEKFRSGPWPGQPLLAVAKERFDNAAGGPTEEQLRQAAEAEARRNRAAPRLPVR